MKNLIINLINPTDGSLWILVTKREGSEAFYLDNFGVKTPPIFLEEYIDLRSDERIQEYDESEQYDFCGEYRLYMIYLIDRGFRIKSALNIIIIQCKYTKIYNSSFSLSCCKL